MRFVGSAMNRLGQSVIIVFLFLVGTGFFSSSDASRGADLAELSASKSNDLKVITAHGREMAGSPNSDSRRKALRAGLWGGEHISMEVTGQRTTVEYDCAHATIEQRIVLDGRGRFNVSGMQVPERGGPVRQNEQASGYPVRFAGQVKGKKMTLSVRNTLTKETIGIFTLVHGAEPKLRKCK